MRTCYWLERFFLVLCLQLLAAGFPQRSAAADPAQTNILYMVATAHLARATGDNIIAVPTESGARFFQLRNPISKDE